MLHSAFVWRSLLHADVPDNDGMHSRAHQLIGPSTMTWQVHVLGAVSPRQPSATAWPPSSPASLHTLPRQACSILLPWLQTSYAHSALHEPLHLFYHACLLRPNSPVMMNFSRFLVPVQTNVKCIELPVVVTLHISAAMPMSDMVSLCCIMSSNTLKV